MSRSRLKIEIISFEYDAYLIEDIFLLDVWHGICIQICVWTVQISKCLRSVIPPEVLPGGEGDLTVCIARPWMTW